MSSNTYSVSKIPLPPGKETPTVRTTMIHRILLLLGALACLPSLALAHHFMGNDLPRTFAQGFLSGLGHPIIGIDHAAFIIAAGFLLALIPHGAFAVAALIAGSLAGAAVHLAGVALPGGEAGVALSVILVGALLMYRRPLALGWAAGGLFIAGLLHGHAYAESIFGAEPTPLGAYLVGFSLIQLGMAGAAWLAHRRLVRVRNDWAPRVSSVLGGAAGTIGLFFLLT
jgi:urease accessory protein